MLSPPYTITGGTALERNFVADSWRRSLQDAPAYARMPRRAYAHFINEIIKHFLGPAPEEFALHPDDRLYVARDKDRPAYVVGWLLGRDMKPGFSLVYLYVRSSDRKQGIAKDLLATALEATEEGALSYSFRTRHDGWFEELGMDFSPVENLEFGPRKAAS